MRVVTFDFSKLRADCEHHVAREIARGRIEIGINAWAEETHKAYPEAREKIDAMSNCELLELIQDVVGPYVS